MLLLTPRTTWAKHQQQGCMAVKGLPIIPFLSIR